MSNNSSRSGTGKNTKSTADNLSALLSATDAGDDQLVELSSRFIIADSLMRTLNRGFTLKDFMREVLLVALGAIKSEAGSILEADYANRTFFFRCAVGQKSSNVEQFSVPFGQGIVGFVAEAKHAFVENQLEKQPQHIAAIAKVAGLHARNLIAAPIIVRGKVFGVVELLNRIGDDRFSQGDIDTISYYCEMAAHAIELQYLLGFAPSTATKPKGERRLSNSRRTERKATDEADADSRSAGGHGSAREGGQLIIDMRYLVRALIKYNASDLHIKVGRPPLFRVNGRLIPAKLPELKAAQVESIVFAIMPPDEQEELAKKKHIDFSFDVEGLGRFRCHVYYQRNTVAAAIRAIPLSIPTVEELGIPSIMRQLVERPRGLILITGATGDGKSTTACVAGSAHQRDERGSHPLHRRPDRIFSSRYQGDRQSARSGQRHAFLERRSLCRSSRRSGCDRHRGTSRLRNDLHGSCRR